MLKEIFEAGGVLRLNFVLCCVYITMSQLTKMWITMNCKINEKNAGLDYIIECTVWEHFF